MPTIEMSLAGKRDFQISSDGFGNGPSPGGHNIHAGTENNNAHNKRVERRPPEEECRQREGPPLQAGPAPRPAVQVALRPGEAGSGRTVAATERASRFR